MGKKAKLKASANPHVMVEVPPRQDPKITDKLWFGRIHWIVGTTPKGMAKNDILNPPVNGWQACFVIPGKKAWTVFDPFLFESYRIIVGNYEQQSFEGPPQCFDGSQLAEWLIKKWEGFAANGNQVDYDIAARVIKELGGKIPTVVPSTRGDDDNPNKERGGKPVATELLKSVKQSSKRGQVLDWFLQGEGPRSIREAMAEFDCSRSSVLSYLHNLNKDHGVGYRLVGDTAEVVLPPCDSPWLE